MMIAESVTEYEAINRGSSEAFLLKLENWVNRMPSD